LRYENPRNVELPQGQRADLALPKPPQCSATFVFQTLRLFNSLVSPTSKCRKVMRADLALPKPPRCRNAARSEGGPCATKTSAMSKCRKVRGRTLRYENPRNVELPQGHEGGPCATKTSAMWNCRKVRGRTLRYENLRNVAQRSYFKRCGSSIPWFTQCRNAARSEDGPCATKTPAMWNCRKVRGRTLRYQNLRNVELPQGQRTDLALRKPSRCRGLRVNTNAHGWEDAGRRPVPHRKAAELQTNSSLSSTLPGGV